MRELLNNLLEDKMGIFKPRDRKEYEEELDKKLNAMDDGELRDFMWEDVANFDDAIMLRVLGRIGDPHFLVNLIFDKFEKKELIQIYKEFIAV